MLKRHMAMCLIATTLGAAPALAQSTTGTSTTTKGSPTNPSASMSDKSGMSKPDANNSSMNSGMNNPGSAAGNASMNKSTGAATMDKSGMDKSTMDKSGNAATMNKSTVQATPMNQTASMKPLAAPGPGQVLGSDLEGTRVYGSNNENVGDISDTLIDSNGQVVAVVVGVGGFLGIGEKDVAIPFKALEIVPQNASASAGAGSMTTAAPRTGGAATTSANESEKGTMNPTKIVLRGMSKADLENAPAFDADADVDVDNAASTSTAR